MIALADGFTLTTVTVFTHKYFLLRCIWTSSCPFGKVGNVLFQFRGSTASGTPSGHTIPPTSLHRRCSAIPIPFASPRKLEPRALQDKVHPRQINSPQTWLRERRRPRRTSMPDLRSSSNLASIPLDTSRPSEL